MKILNNFREFLATGQEQLLDIFEDNGQEKPKPVIVYVYVCDKNCEFDEQNIKEHLFASYIQAYSFMQGVQYSYDVLGTNYNDCVIFADKSKENLIDDVQSYLSGESDESDIY